MQVPKNCKHFLQYTSEVFIPYIYNIYSQAVNIQRTDVVWDCHFQDSLKPGTRNNQGARVRTKVFSSVMGKYQITGQHFSVSVIKKSELFPFLSTQLISGARNDKIVVATVNEMVVSRPCFCHYAISLIVVRFFQRLFLVHILPILFT